MYEGLSDEQLIEELRNGDTAISDFLCDKYKNLVRSKAKSMFILGGDNEDLIQEGMIGLFKAVRDYDAGRDASFYTFAELCISRQMYSAVKASQRLKHFPLNDYVSIYAKKEMEDGESRPLADLLEDRIYLNPESMLLDKERVNYIQEIIENDLSEFEKQVIDLYMTGMSTPEIARVLGREEKSTDNCLQRIKGKLKKLLK